MTWPASVGLARWQRGRTILGTPAYMSPEQARGQAVDKRTDIWAFGCVLFEMLAGRRAFDGETMSDTLVGILEREPDWGRCPPRRPPSIRTLLERCLRKNPRKRLHDVADALNRDRRWRVAGRIRALGCRSEASCTWQKSRVTRLGRGICTSVWHQSGWP